jgi:tRNA(fMet)-specific endonuclease VapC
MYVLDTDILTLYQFGHSTVCRNVARHPSDELAIAILTVEEQLSSWYTLVRRTKGRDELARVYQRFTDNVRFLSQLQILSFSAGAIERFEELKRMKLGVKAMDLRISAVALEHSATVVTRNRRDFECVPGLRVEDWSVEEPTH